MANKIEQDRVSAFNAWTAQPLALWPGAWPEVRAAVVAGVAPAVRAAPPASRLAAAPGSGGGLVAVIPLRGVIVRRASWLSEALGAVVLPEFVARVRSAAADPAVKTIVLLVDSPGGEAGGLEEAATVVWQVARSKPIVAVVEGMAASAAYWLAAQASEVIATASSLTGSIGVYCEHVSVAGAEQAAGLAVTLISSAPKKTDGHPSTPLSDRARADIQEIVDAVDAAFVSAVARGRGTTPARVRAEFGEGGLVLAPAALRVGMVDAVAPVEGALARAASGRVPVRAAALDPGLEVRVRRARAAGVPGMAELVAPGGRASADAAAEIDRRLRAHRLR